MHTCNRCSIQAADFHAKACPVVTVFHKMSLSLRVLCFQHQHMYWNHKQTYFTFNGVHGYWRWVRTPQSRARPASPRLRNWTPETNLTRLERRFLLVAVVTVSTLIICQFHLIVWGIWNMEHGWLLWFCLKVSFTNLLLTLILSGTLTDPYKPVQTSVSEVWIERQ